MTSIKQSRIESVDLLKGLVMVVMALDHTRDYFHYSSFFIDPTDPEQTTWPIFFTRFITHFCAPAFSFLAGVSAFMVGKRKPNHELSGFLVKRGLWLVFAEIMIVSFGWNFDVQYRFIALQTIWSLGMSMIILAGLIHLPKQAILVFSLLIIFGHNLLDNIHFENNVLWSTLHEFQRFEFAGHRIVFAYALLPWIAVMSLGYYVGSFYDTSFDAQKRKKILNGLGAGCMLLFFILVVLNSYGDPVPWQHHDTISKTFMSIFNVSKYPPSLRYLLITLGCTFLFLANSEKLKGKIIDFFCVFGRVPFFYYILHIYLIHLMAAFAAWLTGFGWQALVLPKFITRVEGLKGYGFNLIAVYIVWIIVVVLLYPLCKKFDNYKQNNKDKWWLSYL
ncbi:MAG: heparan-alpha-glucosaminide N-acetyltransferase domain-containing protein [Bacteroidota bacterium]